MRYELPKNNLELVKIFVQKGILSYLWLRDLKIFEEFQALYESNPKKCKSCIYGDLAVKYGLSPLAVYKLIKRVS